MDEATAHTPAEGYLAYTVSGDDAVLGMFSADFFDNVSGRLGLEIFDTVRGGHIGNGFPRLADKPIKGNTVSWPQVHFFRLEDGFVVEHWAVRDDAALLDSVDA